MNSAVTRGWLAGPFQLIAASLLLLLHAKPSAALDYVSAPPEELERACPGALNVDRSAWDHKEVTAPAHRFDVNLPWLPAATPAIRITAWRTPCPGNPSRLRAWLRFSEPTRTYQGNLPRVTVIQNGRTIGRFGRLKQVYLEAGNNSRYLTYFNATPKELSSGDVATGVFQTGALISDNPDETFDPAMPFSLVLDHFSFPGLNLYPSIRVEVPDARAGGNIGFMPSDIAGHWWNPALPGTGLILQRNERETLFAAWMTYDENGRTTWFVMPEGLPTGTGTIDGKVYSPRGPAYPITTSQPPQSAELGSPVGTFSFRFASANSAEFKWSVQGAERIEQIEPLRVAALSSPCVYSSKPISTIEAASGWGVGITGQVDDGGCAVHTTLLTYDSASRPVWYFAPLAYNGIVDLLGYVFFSGTVTSARMAGTLYQPTASPFNQIGQPHSFWLGEPVGTVESKFVISTPPSLTSANSARHIFTYTIRGIRMELDLKRFTFEY